jgi:hypothetical protein
LKGTATQIPQEKVLWIPKLPQREEAISNATVKQKLLQFELTNVPKNINQVPSTKFQLTELKRIEQNNRVHFLPCPLSPQIHHAGVEQMHLQPADSQILIALPLSLCCQELTHLPVSSLPTHQPPNGLKWIQT